MMKETIPLWMLGVVFIGLALLGIFAVSRIFRVGIPGVGGSIFESCSRISTSSSATVGPNGPQGGGDGDGVAGLRATIIGTTSDRAALRISNPSTLEVWLRLGGATATTPGEGIPIYASSTVEFDTTNLYTGSVSAITRGTSGGTGTATLGIFECSY